MSALTFLSDNRVLNADFTMLVGTENTQFPLTNMQSDFTTKVFRSNENAIEFQVDLNATEAIDSFAIVGSSVDGLGLGDVTIYGSATTNFSGATAVSIDVSAANNFGFKFFTAGASYRYWKIVVNNSAGSYVEISNFYLGIKEQFANNGISTETFKYSEVDNSSTKKNRYGQRFIDTYNTIKTMSGQMKYVNAAEFATLNDLYTQNKKSIPIWVVLDPDGDMLTDSEYKFSGYFYFDADLVWSLAAPALYNVALKFSEGT
jgi:hypothetical protein